MSKAAWYGAFGLDGARLQLTIGESQRSSVSKHLFEGDAQLALASLTGTAEYCAERTPMKQDKTAIELKGAQ